MTTLEEYRTEIVATSTAAGWYEDTRTVGEECALLHSEVSEAFEAYRDNGLSPFFRHTGPLGMGSAVLLQGDAPAGVKPEGAGSELADVLIRLLDTSNRMQFDLTEMEAASVEATVRLNGSFGDDITELHKAVSNFFVSGNPIVGLAHVLATLRGICEKHELDLIGETDRKLAYNKTRSYRHGGKRI